MDEKNRQVMRELLQERDSWGTEQEMQVITLAYGLEDGKARTSQEVADILGVSRERVQIMQKNIVTRMSRHKVSRRKVLSEYLD